MEAPLPYPTLPYPTLPYPTFLLPYPILLLPYSYPILPYSHPTLPYRTLACPTPHYPALFLPYTTVPYLTHPILLLPYPTLPYSTIPNPTRPYVRGTGVQYTHTVSTSKRSPNGLSAVTGVIVSRCAPQDTCSLVRDPHPKLVRYDSSSRCQIFPPGLQPRHQAIEDTREPLKIQVSLKIELCVPSKNPNLIPFCGALYRADQSVMATSVERSEGEFAYLFTRQSLMRSIVDSMCFEL